MMAFVAAAARFLTRVAAVFLLAMVAVNVVDVGLRSGFNAPIFGTYEIVGFLLAGVAFLAIPEAFLRDRHITIELIDQIVPARAVGWLRVFGTSTALFFVALLAWHMVQPALDYVEFNDITMATEGKVALGAQQAGVGALIHGFGRAFLFNISIYNDVAV